MGDAVVCLVILETGERKKLCLPTGAYNELMEALGNIAVLSDNTLIQIHDADFDEFVDLEKGTPVPDKSRLKVSRKVALPVDDSLSVSEISLEVPSGSTLSSQESSEHEVVTVPLLDKQDYLKFKLPSFHPYEKALERRTPISGSLRRFVVERLFQECYKIAWYPSRQLYRTAALQLVTKYPHLMDKIEGSSGVDSWVLGIRNKFKNTRKKTECYTDGMAEMKQKFLHKGPRTSASEGNSKRTSRLSDCSHLEVQGETAESVAETTDWLKRNARTSSDEELRPQLLATAKARHEKIRTLNVAEALVSFPFLSTESSLLMEFDILFKCEILNNLESGFSHMLNILYETGNEKEMAALSTSSGDYVRCLIELLASRCGDDLGVIFTEADVPLTPCVMAASCSYFLYVDRHLMFQPSCTLAAIACLFAAFWVFNIEYPRKAHRLLSVIEHAFLGLNQTKPRVKAVELINLYKSSLRLA